MNDISLWVWTVVAMALLVTALSIYAASKSKNRSEFLKDIAVGILAVSLISIVAVKCSADRGSIFLGLDYPVSGEQIQCERNSEIDVGSNLIVGYDLLSYKYLSIGTDYNHQSGAACVDEETIDKVGAYIEPRYGRLSAVMAYRAGDPYYYVKIVAYQKGRYSIAPFYYQSREEKSAGIAVIWKFKTPGEF